MLWWQAPLAILNVLYQNTKYNGSRVKALYRSFEPKVTHPVSGLYTAEARS